jgi:arsenate reductase-like glutaredoxin family protein
VREFLARNHVEHGFEDIRKEPVSPKDTLAIVRKHRVAIAKRGQNLVRLDPRTATDEEILKAFLGREGTMRAPTVSVGDTIVAGFDASTFRDLFQS